MLEYARRIQLLPESHTLCSVADVFLFTPPVDESLRVEDAVEHRTTDTNTLVPKSVCVCGGVSVWVCVSVSVWVWVGGCVCM